MSIYDENMKTKTMKKIKEEVLNIIREYTTEQSKVLILGSHNDSIVDEIDFESIFLVDLEFVNLEYEEDETLHFFEMDLNDFITYAIDLGTKFDVIVMNEVVEHLTMDQMTSCFNRIKSILRLGGVFILGYPNCRSINRLLGVEMNKIPFPEAISMEDRRVGHKKMYSVSGINHFKFYLGLDPIRVEGIMFKPLPNSLMDKYFSEDLDKFIQIGKDLGARTCGYIIAVYK